MLSLSTDKSLYKVGEIPTYIIHGGSPNGGIAWTSYKNGAPTGEFQAFYGQTLDVGGNATLPAGGPWTEDYIGTWEKELLIVGTDGSFDIAQTTFRVAPQTAMTTQTPVLQAPATQSQPGFFEGNTNLFGLIDIPFPPFVVYGGLVLLAVMMFSGSGGRR